MMKKILYISTNHIYGGSEKLWMSSAKEASKNYFVTAFVHYQSDFIDDLQIKNGIKIYKSTFNESKFKGWLRTRFSGSLDLKLILLRDKPDLVIINEGGVFSSFKEMTLCKQLNIPYIVLNGLVSDFHWFAVENAFYERFIYLYESARKVIFVSDQNKELFSEMLVPIKNTLVVKNPVSYYYETSRNYPETSHYNIAFVGRLEFFHKGLDLLIHALQDSKWLNRNVTFNFYGDGPHRDILKYKIKTNKLIHCLVHESNYDFKSIWSFNHIAIHTSRFEGKSLSITEAMYNKRAIIMTNVGGVSELIVEGLNGFIANEVTLEGVKNTLERAWMNRDRWHEMGIKSREVYDRLNKNLTLNQLIFS